MFAVAVAAAGAAAFGPIYLNSADQATLNEALNVAAPYATGLTIVSHATTATVAEIVPADIPRPASGGRWFARPILSGTAASTITLKGRPYAITLSSRTGACHHVRIVEGHCSTTTGTAMLSARSAHFLGLSIGDTIKTLTNSGRGTLSVSGLYAPGNASAPFWWGHNFFGFDTQLRTAPTLDNAFVSAATLHEIAHATATSTTFEVPLLRHAVTVGNAGALSAAVTQFQQFARTGNVGVGTQLVAVLAKAAGTEHTAATIVDVVDLELVLLAIFVLYFVATRAAAEREPDVWLAELRGHRPRRIVEMAMAEPIVVVVAAVPIGILGAWGLAAAIGPVSYGSRIGASVTVLSALAAVAAGVAGIIATAIGTRQGFSGMEDPADSGPSDRRRLLRAVGDALVVALAAAAFFELVTGGVSNSPRSSTDTLAALAPGLLALALGILGARLLPLVLRATHRRSADSPRMTLALATRTVARRRDLTSLVILVTLAVGLATFSVSGLLVSGRNRDMRVAYDVGAPQVLTVAVHPGTTFLHAVRAADPSGRGAMAAMLARASDGTTLAVDASRMASVMEWPSTLGTSVETVARRLVPRGLAPTVRISGNDVALSVDTTTMRATPAPQVSIELFDDDYQASSHVELGTLRPGSHTYRASIPRTCKGGCRLVDVALSWTRGSSRTHPKATVALHVTAIESSERGRWNAVAASLWDPSRWVGAGGAQVVESASSATGSRSGTSAVSSARDRTTTRGALAVTAVLAESFQ